MHVKKGDVVYVLSGKDRGKQGKVIRVIPDSRRVVVEGVNIVKRHVRARPPRVMQAGIIEQEAPIHASNVLPVCSACGRPTRVGRMVLEDGSRVRRCKRCGEVLDR
ncbi:MAG: 50S ribosomal protein L24 [Clostridia bacterium]|nr:50S ribosomal protein L24 [Clostridia bacterium]